MFTVYILYSYKDHKLYVGCTRDITERVKKHNAGGVDATKHRRPLECIHTEEFDMLQEAYAREQFLKSLWSGRFKKKLKDRFEAQLKT